MSGPGGARGASRRSCGGRRGDISTAKHRSTAEVAVVTSSTGPRPPPPVPSAISMQSDQSMRGRPEFTEDYTESISADARPPSPVSTLHCDQSMDVPDVTFTGEHTQTSVHTAGPRGVVCAACPKRAFKACLTCTASFCETHVSQHYTAPALQRHQLVEATEDLEQRLCQHHHRHLEFFCNTDQRPVCASCVAKQHRGHDIAELEEHKMTESALGGQKNVPAPRAVKVTSVKTDSVCLSWGAPEGLTQPHPFRVTWRSEAGSGSLTVPGQEVDIQQLSPGEQYTFTVSTLYDDGSQSPCVSATVSTGKEQSASTRSSNRSPFEIKPFPKETLAVQHQLIKKGPPDCYRLPTRKSTFGENGAVRRWTFGQRDETATVKNILIVGETGTGKTTLINAIVNYLLGVQWDDGFWFQITEEEDKERSQAESQTAAITVYEVFVNTSSLSLRIIDTPGYGSTDGLEIDKNTAKYLDQLFRSEDGIHEINAVGLVVKSGQNRLTLFQHYIFDAILSLFGKDIEKSIVMLITHSDGMSVDDIFTALNEAKVPCARQASGEPVHFMFNNIQSMSYKEKNKDLCQRAWDLSYIYIETLLEFLRDAGATELEMTKGVLRERKRLEACVSNLHDAIRMEELKQDQLQQTQRALEENKEKCGNNEDFTFKVKEPYKEKILIDPSLHTWTRKATCCTVCEENCHYPGCWWVKDLSWCSVMRNGRCTVCIRKCPVTDHVKENKIYVVTTREVEKTYKDLKQRYEKHVDVDVKKGLEKELAESKMKKKKLLDDAYQHIVTLEKIALKKDSGSTLMHLDFLIEKMKEMGEDEKVEKLMNLNQQLKKNRMVQWWSIRF